MKQRSWSCRDIYCRFDAIIVLIFDWRLVPSIFEMPVEYTSAKKDVFLHRAREGAVSDKF